MRMIHVSDLHLNLMDHDSNTEKIVRFFEHIAAMHPEHLIITGDISENGEEEELLAFRDILEHIGYYHSEKTTVVIGNHDIFGGVHRAEDILTFPERCVNTDYYSKVLKFHSLFGELYENCMYPIEGSVYPFVKLVKHVAIAGVNSIAEYSKVKNIFASRGKINDAQYEGLYEALLYAMDEADMTLVAIHHHFNKIVPEGDQWIKSIWSRIEKQTMNLKKKKRLIQMFNIFGVKAVLHGHYHVMDTYERSGIQYVNSGASFKNSAENTVYYHALEIGRKLLVANLEEFSHSPRKYKKIAQLLASNRSA